MIETTVGEDTRSLDDGTGVNTKEVSKDLEPDENMELNVDQNADAKRCEESVGEHVDAQNLLKEIGELEEDSIGEHGENVDTQKLLQELSELGSEGGVKQRGKHIGLRRITRSKARANQTEQ